MGCASARLANIQEGTVRALYEAVLEPTGVGPDTRYLDVSCGARGASFGDRRARYLARHRARADAHGEFHIAVLRLLLPPPDAPGPFALSDEATLRAFAASAGPDTNRGAPCR
jgi:hypothetical protein